MFSIFLILILNIWEEFKVLSRFIQKLIQPPAGWDHGLFRILSSYWLSQFYLLKKSTKVLLYFGLDCGLLVFFKYSSHKPYSQEQLLTLPHFWSTVRRKRSRFVPIQPVISKTYNGWCPFLCLSNDSTLMKIQSSQTVHLKQSIASQLIQNKWSGSLISLETWRWESFQSWSRRRSTCWWAGSCTTSCGLSTTTRTRSLR